MRNDRTLGEVTEEYLRNHPEEIDNYISVLLGEYTQNGDEEVDEQEWHTILAQPQALKKITEMAQNILQEHLRW